jgi:hypothetical protein
MIQTEVGRAWPESVRHHPIGWGPGLNKSGEGGSPLLPSTCELHSSSTGSIDGYSFYKPLCTPIPASSAFQCGLPLATLLRASRPSASDLGCIIGPSFPEAPGFLDWAATGFPGSVAHKWPLWDCPASDRLSQSNKSLYIQISISSFPLENPHAKSHLLQRSRKLYPR